MQKLTNDLAAPWFLELWTIASTPAKAGRLRKSRVERLLKQYRIRRIDAETVLRILREPAIKVAEGVAEAASIHIRSLVARLRTVNRELREAERKLDELCTAISEIEQTSGESLQRRDVAILRSMPGIGRINLGTFLSEAAGEKHVVRRLHFRQREFARDGARANKSIHGFLRRFSNPGIAVAPKKRIPDTDANSAQIARASPSDQLEWIEAGGIERGKAVGEVGDTARQQSGRVERKRQRHDASGGPAPDRDLQPRIAGH